MKLLVTTPTQLVVDEDGVLYLRAEDETGAFGILPGHADFLTVLEVSVISWRDSRNHVHHLAVRGGMLTVRDGSVIEIATREAVAEKDLAALGAAVLDRFRADAASEQASRVSTAQLHMAAMRQIEKYLESTHHPVPAGGPQVSRHGGIRQRPSAQDIGEA